MQSDGAEADEGHYVFFSAPASPVHYILRSPPSSTAGPAAVAADGGDCCGEHAGAGDFEFFAARAGGGMSSAEELFVAGRIRVGAGGGLTQEDAGREDDREDSGGDDEAGRDGRGGRCAPRTRRARSVSSSPSPREATGAEPSSDPFASDSSSSSSSSVSAKNTRRKISLRDLLTGTGSGGDSGTEQGGGADTAGGAGARPGTFWAPSIWPSRSKQALLPCPAPLPGRRSTSSDRNRRTAAPAKKLPPGGSSRRTTSLPYRQGLVLGCLGYGLAKSMHPLYSR